MVVSVLLREGWAVMAASPRPWVIGQFSGTGLNEEAIMTGFAILNSAHDVVECDLITWAQMFESSEARRVARDSIDGVDVSTVFLGLDHSFGNGPALWFETMVFGGPLDQEMERYTTWAEAVAGHEDMVERVRGCQS